MINVLKEVQAMSNMASTKGLTVELLPDGEDQPFTDMATKILYLPRPKYDWGNEEIMEWRSSAWHEVGHHHPSQTALTEAMHDQKISYTSPLGTAINCIDDVWQEMVTSREYVGAGRILSFGQGCMVERGVQTIEKHGVDGIDPVLLDGCLLSYAARSDWQPHVEDLLPKLEKLTGPTKYGHLIDRINNIIDHPNPAQETIDIAKELVEENGIDPESKEGKGDPDAEKQEEEERAKGEGEGDPVDGKVSYEELMGHSHGKKHEGTPAKFDIEYDHYRSGDYVPYNPNEFITGIPKGRIQPSQYRELKEVYEGTMGVSNRVANLFQTATQTGITYQQKRGKLTGKHLTRGAMGDPRIFNRKSNRIDNKAAISFLVDCSGSMAWGKYGPACAAMGHLSRALCIAQVPHKVAGFTEEEPHCYHYTIKDWEEKFSWDTMAERFGKVDLVQNADGDNLMYAYNEMLARDDERKIMIVLSDGQPACDRPGDAYSYLQTVTRHIESQGAVELYGIGILTDSVNSFYTENTVLNSTDEIEQCLTEVVKSKIIKG